MALHVPTSINPAHLGTRFVPASQLRQSCWLTGPEFLRHHEECSEVLQGRFELIGPDLDADVRPYATSLATSVSMRGLDTGRFERFSSWTSLTHAMEVLVHASRNFRNRKSVQDLVSPNLTRPSGKHLARAKTVTIRSAQCEAYSELNCVGQKNLAKSSPLWKLDPWVDGNGLLKIGGRLRKAQWNQDESKPIVIPGHHHIAMLLVRHYHEVKHQGRHLSEGVIRAACF